MAANNPVIDVKHEGEIAVITVDSPPVNALSAAVRDGLYDSFTQAAADSAVKAIVLMCAGRTFVAGADISEFGKAPAARGLHEVLRVIEDIPKPVVAAIHGTALGGGLELALCCHYRVAVPSARCGLPEVKLGLLPGAGGTQRLPRIAGVERALEMVTSGEHVSAAECAAMGLIDALVDEGKLREGAVAFARNVLAEGRPLRKIRDLHEKVEAARGKPEIFDNFRKAIARRARGMLAPEYNIRCIEAAVNLPFDEGIKREVTLFAELMAGTQSAAQRYIFFAERTVWKIPDIPPGTPNREIKKVGIIGAGTMGGGIAMNFANAGLPVTLVEQAQAQLDRGLSVVRRNYDNTAKKGRLTPADVGARMGLIQGSLALEDLADCDLIIEAVFENMDIKKDVFTRLDHIAKPGAILATNTSGLDIDEIASVTGRPEDVIGLHFFSPANVMRLLEVVRARKTGMDVIATSMAMAKKIGKIAALVRVCPRFVGNRILAQRQREAQNLILEGAMPWDVDRVLYDFGFPMGPFAMADLAGLDIGWRKETSKGDTMRDLLCERGRLGQKSGAGFYRYDEHRNASPDPDVEALIVELSRKKGIERRTIADEEILERCIYPMVNEGAKILEEGIAIRASDIDVIWINGYGFPVYRGGPMFYADTVGLDKVLARLRQFESQLGPDFKPANLLVRLASEGKRFQNL
jgi:3-hydroxyacyl-CoA dehydrogenase